MTHLSPLPAASTTQTPQSARLETAVRLQALDGVWETCGVDRLRGIVPEDIQLSSNRWGSDTCTFTLRRDPGGIYPDLEVFTPCEVEVGGVVVWSGRVHETPTKEDSDSTVSVSCRGWQYHLDDDVYSYTYVHADLGDWRDIRSHPSADLTTSTSAPQVESGDGIIKLAFGEGIAVAANTRVGVFLDLGASIAKRVVATWDAYNVAANQTINLNATDTIGTAGDAIWATSLGTGGASSGTSTGTLGTRRRYLWLYLTNASGGPVTPTLSEYWRLLTVQVFSDASYESGNSSVLKADAVVKDARNQATLLLDSSNGAISTGTFSIPEMAFTEPRTPREVMEAANAYHAWRLKIDVNRRVVFQAQPSAPLFEVGAWAGAEFTDAAAGSGEEIYSHVLVQATGPDGQPLRVSRSQAQQSGAAVAAISTPAADNPSFATNTTSWTAGTSTITRDTGVFDSSPASGRWDNTGASDSLGMGDTLTETFTGSFVSGENYMLTFRARTESALLPIFEFAFGSGADLATGVVNYGVGSFATTTISWTPVATVTNVTLRLTVASGVGGYLRIDSLALYRAAPTMVDRRGFKRTKILPVSAAMSQAGAEQIGNIYLSEHVTTPLKGTLTVAGLGGIRQVLGGTAVHPAHMLLHTGELVRLSHRIDPDTGAVGRDGRIASVEYDANDDVGTISLDNERHRFEALLERLDIVTGQIK